MTQRSDERTDGVKLVMADEGEGAPVLVLHGGGGPATVAPIAAHMARRGRVLTPTHPGWDGTERPDWCTGIDDLAILYLDVLRARGLHGATVIGSSIGGWLAAEMAVRDRGGSIAALVLIDSVGIAVPGQPIADVFALDPGELATLSFHEPDRFRIDPAALPPERVAMQQSNMDVMRLVAGDPYMHDPKLRRRLRDVTLPTLVIWGESDRIATPRYGSALAEAFPDGRFVPVARAGHLPQLEQPEATMALIDTFVAEIGVL